MRGAGDLLSRMSHSHCLFIALRGKAAARLGKLRPGGRNVGRKTVLVKTGHILNQPFGFRDLGGSLLI